jgi:hypothetical protein
LGKISEPKKEDRNKKTSCKKKYLNVNVK